MEGSFLQVPEETAFREAKKSKSAEVYADQNMSQVAHVYTPHIPGLYLGLVAPKAVRSL